MVSVLAGTMALLFSGMVLRSEGAEIADFGEVVAKAGGVWEFGEFG